MVTGRMYGGMRPKYTTPFLRSAASTAASSLLVPASAPALVSARSLHPAKTAAAKNHPTTRLIPLVLSLRQHNCPNRLGIEKSQAPPGPD
jgi:hypothetical protein